ncbi:outer membrane protein assembly factor BamB family protein [Timonella senegalensis]|uniref:outer membrane protein assembly factor BamB family protein n=1 Tax=Timonella senegalensis TaxID=1465825 RepID=UPI0003075CBF|nr:PQQ-binding-like beta-propeller repeat protein [Timonella senegalensis]
MKLNKYVALAVLAATSLVTAACGPSEPEPERTPQVVETPLSPVDTSDLWLPTQFDELEIVDPGWQTTPQYRDGVYLAAAEREGLLEFTAVDVYGAVLWAVQRPATCTGFALTVDATGRSLAVLSDVESSVDDLVATTASAYDLNTGELVWGPIAVPGRHIGPGLVYGPPPADFMGESGPRVVLNPTTGVVAASEAANGGVRVIGEYGGTVLLADKDSLTASDASDGSELWSIPLAKNGWEMESLSPDFESSPVDGFVFLGTSDATRALVDLDDGTVISDSVQDAAVDAATGYLTVLDDAGLHSFDSENTLQRSVSVSDNTSISASGGVLLYLREGDTVRVHNVLTGDIAQAYAPGGHGRIIVPSHMTEVGAAILLDGSKSLLATVPEFPTSTEEGNS